MTLFARVAIAAIAVIALAGGAIYFFGTGQRVGGAPPTPSPSVTSAPSPGSSTSAAIDAGAGTLLYEIKVPADAVPSWDGVSLALAHFTIAPDTSSVWKASTGPCCSGPKMKFILEGTLKVVSDGPLQVIRAGAAPETISVGTEVLLKPGDMVISRNEIGDTWTSVGPGAVELLDTTVLSGIFLDAPPEPHEWDNPEYDVRETISLPAGPQRLRLRRVKVATSEVLSSPPGGRLLGLIFMDAGIFFSRQDDGTLKVSGKANVSADSYVLTQEPG